MTLSCGVNDVWHGEKGVPLDQYKTNITAIVDQCRKAGVQVVLLTSTPIGENLDNGNNAKLAAYNEFLRTLAREKQCRLADLSADFHAAIKARTATGATGNGFTTDGVHMNAAGNRLMAVGVLRALGLDEAQMRKAETFWDDSLKAARAAAATQPKPAPAPPGPTAPSKAQP
jgi:lysophospholipase L1-like esterase